MKLLQFNTENYHIFLFVIHKLYKFILVFGFIIYCAGIYIMVIVIKFLCKNFNDTDIQHVKINQNYHKTESVKLKQKKINKIKY